MARATIKVNASRLPEPLLEPTRDYHTPPPKPTAAELLRARDDLGREERDVTGGKGWRDDEVDMLLGLRAQGKTFVEIAERIGRSEKSVRAKYIRENGGTCK